MDYFENLANNPQWIKYVEEERRISVDSQQRENQQVKQRSEKRKEMPER